MKTSNIAVAAVLALASFAAAAQTYRCTSKDGKKYYGATIPQQCIGQTLEVLNSQGTIIRRIEPQSNSEADRAAKEAELAKKREDDNLVREEKRRNNALLATYTSEKDIDEARGRAIAENQKAVKEVETRIDAIKKRQATFQKEMEFYTEGAKPDSKGKPGAKPGAGAKPPPKLLEDMKNAEIDLKAQETLLAAKQKEVDGINARYDEDKKRYTELTKPAKR